MTFYASIKTEYKQKLLRRSTFLGAIGVIPLVLAAWFGTYAFLEVYGLPLFLCAIAVISVGMIPLRRIERIEANPPTLSVEDGALVYREIGKSPCLIERNSISNVEHVLRGERYGISVTIKGSSPHFFPYFTERSARDLSDALFDDVLHS